jgi:O-antigen ligase
LEIGLYSMAGLWLAGLIASRAFTKASVDQVRIPKLLPVLIILLLGYGWTRAGNPSSFFDPYFLRFEAVPQVAPFWPGTVDAAASREAMVRISALLLVVLFAANLGRDPRWRARVLATMAATGISIALFGVAQKIAQAPLLFWEPERFSGTTFAMYRYHANAGAFLNLVWPPCAALAYGAFRKQSAYLGRALWLPGLLILIAGLALNISKGGHLVAALLALAALGAGVRLFRRSERAPSVKWWLAAAMIVVASAAVVTLIGVHGAADRWQELGQRELGTEGRLWMARACLDMARDRPLAGFGPGTFPLLVPFYSHPYPQLGGVWLHAHCDYLQTLVEWGVGGFIFWAALVLGGLIRLVRRIRGRTAGILKRRRAEVSVPYPVKSSRLTKTFEFAILLSLTGVFIHALFDFPLEIASLQLYAAVLLGLAWSSRKAPDAGIEGAADLQS